MVIVLLVGMPGSGKGVFSDIAEKEAGFRTIRMGDVVREEAQKNDVPPDDSVGEFASRQRDENGSDIWAVRTSERVPDGNVVIDGCRSQDEASYFLKRFGEGIKIVSVFSPPGERYKRLRQRGRADDPDNMEDFLRRDHRELNWGLGNILATAHYVIPNTGSLADMERMSREVLDMVLSAEGNQ